MLSARTAMWRPAPRGDRQARIALAPSQARLAHPHRLAHLARSTGAPAVPRACTTVAQQRPSRVGIALGQQRMARALPAQQVSQAESQGKVGQAWAKALARKGPAQTPHKGQKVRKRPQPTLRLERRGHGKRSMP